MPVDKEELLKDLETPEYQGIVKDALVKKEYVVQDKTENAAFLDRYKKDVIEREIPGRIKEVYDNIDKEVKGLFGIDRDPNEKTYDYLKRAGSLQTQALTSSADKIRTLEEAIAKGDTSAAMAKKLEAEEQRFKKLLGDKDKELNEVRSESQRTRKAADVKLIYGELKKGFVKTLPPLFSKIEAAVLDEVVRNSVEKDGVLYMANPDGSIKKDSSYNEIKVEDHLKAEFKEVIETQKKQGGGGSGSNGGQNDDPGNDPSKITADNFTVPAGIKTKVALTDYMISLGLKQGTDQFNKIWTKHGRPMTA